MCRRNGSISDDSTSQERPLLSLSYTSELQNFGVSPSQPVNEKPRGSEKNPKFPRSMGFGQQAFQTMTSYIQELENNVKLIENRPSRAHSDTYTADTPHPTRRLPEQPRRPYRSAFTQGTYLNPSTEAQSMQHSHVSQSSQQRIRDHDDHPDGRAVEYEYSSYTRSQPSYESRGSHHSMEQYSASLEQGSTSTRPKLNSQLTIDSLDHDDHNYRQPRPDASLLDYREALREYHSAQSTFQEHRTRHEPQHDGLQDDRDHTRFRSRHESSPSYLDDMKDPERRSPPYDISLLTTASSIPMSNYPPSPLATGHRLPRFDFRSHRNQSLEYDDLEDIPHLPQSSRHHHHHPRQQQMDIAVTDVIPPLPSFEPSSSERHSASTRHAADPLSHNYNFIRHPSPSSPSYHQHQHQQRHQNFSAHPRPRPQHHGRSAFPYQDHIDPQSLVNEDDQLEEAYDQNLNPDPRSHSSAISQQDEHVARSGTVTAASEPAQEQVPVKKKKKKSKMHECEVCQKKFPRPSGLKTHMNTHNNERPYPCGFPGCDRTFGVRSNAKRHLRTHGILPTPAVNPGPAYVVGFETPVILPDHVPDGHNYSQGAGVSTLQRPDADHDELPENDGDEDQSEQRQEGIGGARSSSRAPLYKVRWMPPSLKTHTNSTEPVDYDKQPSMEHTHIQDSVIDNPYQLKLRHDYEHAPGHGENLSYSHPPRHKREHSRHHYPHLNHDLKRKQRRVEDPTHSPDLGAMEYALDFDLHTHPSPLDADVSVVSPSSSRPGTASSFTTTGSRVSYISSRGCMCSPPCPVDASGNISCRSLATQPVYVESKPGRRFSESSPPHSATVGPPTRRATFSATSASRKTKEENITILPKLE